MKQYKQNVKSILITGLLLTIAMFWACSDDDKELAEVIKTESITPNENLRPGDIITIKGEGLDRIKQVRFGESVLVSQHLFSIHNADEISLAIPEQAPSGNLYLIATDNLLPNVLAGTVGMVLPILSDVSPLQLIPGEFLTITGTNLDLISNVKIGTTDMSSIKLHEKTKMEVFFPKDMTMGGMLTATTLSGEEISFGEPITLTTPYYTPSVTSVDPNRVREGEAITIVGKHLNWIDRIVFDTEHEVTVFGEQTENLIEVDVPRGVNKGIINIVMYTPMNDEISFTLNILGGVDPIEDPDLLLLDFETGLANDSWDGIGKEITIGGISGKFYEITTDKWAYDKFWLFADNWRGNSGEGTYPSVTPKSNYVVKVDILLRQDIPATNAKVDLLLAGQNNAVNILPYLINADGSNWSTEGEWKTISIPLTKWTTLPDPTPSAANAGEWGMTIWDDKSNFTGFCVDNVRYELKK